MARWPKEKMTVAGRTSARDLPRKLVGLGPACFLCFSRVWSETEFISGLFGLMFGTLPGLDEETGESASFSDSRQ